MRKIEVWSDDRLKKWNYQSQKSGDILFVVGFIALGLFLVTLLTRIGIVAFALLSIANTLNHDSNSTMAILEMRRLHRK